MIHVDADAHGGERGGNGNEAQAKRRQDFEEAHEEHDGAGQDVRRVGDVGRELERPGHGHRPAPDEPPGHRWHAARDVPGEERERAERQDVQDHDRRFRSRHDMQWRADEEALERARNLALGPHDVRPEVRPLAGRVVAEADQEDLRLVLGEESQRQAEIQAEREQREQSCGKQPCSAVSHRVVRALFRGAAAGKRAPAFDIDKGLLDVRAAGRADAPRRSG